jgi:hypothetical protein
MHAIPGAQATFRIFLAAEGRAAGLKLRYGIAGYAYADVMVPAHPPRAAYPKIARASGSSFSGCDTLGDFGRLAGFQDF